MIAAALFGALLLYVLIDQIVRRVLITASPGPRFFAWSRRPLVDAASVVLGLIVAFPGWLPMIVLSDGGLRAWLLVGPLCVAWVIAVERVRSAAVQRVHAFSSAQRFDLMLLLVVLGGFMATSIAMLVDPMLF